MGRRVLGSGKIREPSLQYVQVYGPNFQEMEQRRAVQLRSTRWNRKWEIRTKFSCQVYRNDVKQGHVILHPERAECRANPVLSLVSPSVWVGGGANRRVLLKRRMSAI